MSPAQVDVLARVHRRVHGGKGSRRDEPDQGSTADLLALSKMRAV